MCYCLVMTSSRYRALADLVVGVHLAFVLFVALGGFLTLRWPRGAWLHAPAFLWGALISFAGWVCPLTPLENGLRHKDGAMGYSSTFIEHYILPVLYPAELTRALQIKIGWLVLIGNFVIYAVAWRRARRKASKPPAA